MYDAALRLLDVKPPCNSFWMMFSTSSPTLRLGQGVVASAITTVVEQSGQRLRPGSRDPSGR
jgi:hypothetical protein